jgi:hypothetical protein
MLTLWLKIVSFALTVKIKLTIRKGRQLNPGAGSRNYLAP